MLPAAVEPAPPFRAVAGSADARRLFAPIARERVEVAVFAYLDRSRAMRGLRTVRSPSVDWLALPVRDVVNDALALEARLVVMAHNHPSGIAVPSADDIAATRRLAGALELIGIRLCDHLVLAGDRCASLRDMGLM